MLDGRFGRRSVESSADDVLAEAGKRRLAAAVEPDQLVALRQLDGARMFCRSAYEACQQEPHQ